jgi:hypothetical protein
LLYKFELARERRTGCDLFDSYFDAFFADAQWLGDRKQWARLSCNSQTLSAN